jgi:hypothetical protein
MRRLLLCNLLSDLNIVSPVSIKQLLVNSPTWPELGGGSLVLPIQNRVSVRVTMRQKTGGCEIVGQLISVIVVLQ